MKQRTFFFLVLVALAHGVAFADVPTSKAITFEQLKTGHIAVKMKFNDKGDYRLILDTGSPVTLLSRKAAEQIGIIQPATANQPKLPDSPFSSLLAGMGGVKSVGSASLETHRVKEMSVVVMDHPVVDLLSQVVGRIDGIVGYPFLSQFRMTLDYVDTTLHLTPVPYTPQDVTQSLMARMMLRETPKTYVAAPALWGMNVAKSDEEDGVTITKVYLNSAAHTAGLRVGDRLLTIDGRWTDSVKECIEAAGFVAPKQKATLRLLRDQKPLTITLTPRLGL